MSWDIFVQDLPIGISTLRDVPDDFEPKPIGTRTQIIKAIQETVPEADFTDPSWGNIDGPGLSIEVNLGHDEEVTGFAFHVRGGGMAAGVVAAILKRLNLSAIDTGADSGIFDIATAQASFERWQTYRDQVIRTHANLKA